MSISPLKTKKPFFSLCVLSFVSLGAVSVYAQEDVLDIPPPPRAEEVDALEKNPAPAVDADEVVVLEPEKTTGGRDVENVTGDSPEMPAEESLSDPNEEFIYSGANDQGIPAPSAADEEDFFFDAESLAPRGEIAKSAPQEVDPRNQPGAKFIVVRKNFDIDSTEANLAAAERASKLGLHESALDIYNRLFAKNNKDPRVILGRAVTLQHLEQFDAAIQAYESLLSMKPENLEARINMLGLMSQRYPSVAIRRLMTLREKYPDNVGILAQLAVAQAKLGDFKGAIRHLGIASGLEPNNASHVFNLAVVADRAGNTDDAVRYYEKALEVDSIYGRGKSVPRTSIYERLADLR